MKHLARIVALGDSILKGVQVDPVSKRYVTQNEIGIPDLERDFGLTVRNDSHFGASTVKGLAFGTDIPCIGVSTLEAVADNLIGFDGVLCPVMNARRSQVYNALFRAQAGVLTRLCDDRAIPIAQLDTELAGVEPALPIYLSGDGYDITHPALASVKDRLRTTPVPLRPQNAYSVAQIAKARYEAGERTTDIEMIPVYLRPCQAERERMERLAQQEQKQ